MFKCFDLKTNISCIRLLNRKHILRQTKDIHTNIRNKYTTVFFQTPSEVKNAFIASKMIMMCIFLLLLSIALSSEALEIKKKITKFFKKQQKMHEKKFTRMKPNTNFF